MNILKNPRKKVELMAKPVGGYCPALSLCAQRPESEGNEFLATPASCAAMPSLPYSWWCLPRIDEYLLRQPTDQVETMDLKC